MPGSYQQTTIDLSNAISLRLNELGFAMSKSHILALVADIIQICVNDSVNVVGHTATDNAILKPPPHTRF
jgi:hypothetical protein